LHQIGVNWIGFGYFPQAVDKLNSFQLIITDRSDIGVSDFDFEFNYHQIQWETGDASGGSDGLGGSSARAGWSNGSLQIPLRLLAPQSMVPCSILICRQD
jgi:hypothetical protein